MRLIDLDAKEPYLLDGRYAVYLIDNTPTVEPICPYLSDDEVKQPCLQAPCERPMFNRAELEKALDYWYNNQEVGNEEQNEMVWCAINAIKYCIEHSSDYQK